MNQDLAEFLSGREPIATEEVVWGETFRFEVNAVLADRLPPLACISSARAIVFRETSVLVQRDRLNQHILPGGRMEDGETPEETVRREVAEESGWSVGPLTLLGVNHFHHLTPKPSGYPYPYPDFCWPIYFADAIDLDPARRLDDGFEMESTLLDVARVRALPLTPIQHAYLNAVIRIRIPRS